MPKRIPLRSRMRTACDQIVLKVELFWQDRGMPLQKGKATDAARFAFSGVKSMMEVLKELQDEKRLKVLHSNTGSVYLMPWLAWEGLDDIGRRSLQYDLDQKSKYWVNRNSHARPKKPQDEIAPTERLPAGEEPGFDVDVPSRPMSDFLIKD